MRDDPLGADRAFSGDAPMDRVLSPPLRLAWLAGGPLYGPGRHMALLTSAMR